MLRRFLFRFLLLLRYADSRPAEMYNALIATAWGLWLLMPWDAWGGSVIYRPLLYLAPEHIWGIVYFAVGSAHVLTALSGHGLLRRLFSFVGVIQWTLVAALFFIGQAAATATVMYGALAVSSLWVFVRIGLIGGYDHER